MKNNNDKKIDKIFDFLSIANDLKTTERWLSLVGLKRRESTADHSWKMSLMTMIFTSELNLKLDTLKVLRMSVVHDLIEAITGDVDHSLIGSGRFAKEDKINNEKKAIEKIKKSLPLKSGLEIYRLWHEFEEAKTSEARFAKAVDRLETINHYLLSYDLKKFGRKEGYRPDFLAVYGDKALSEFPELTPFLRAMKIKLRKIYKEAGIKWLKEYDRV